jgi:hypothetical protein
MNDDINQEAIKQTIDSDMVGEIRICRGDELNPNELLIFCGSAAHRKFIEIKGIIKKEKEIAAGPCKHEWPTEPEAEAVCTKCGYKL